MGLAQTWSPSLLSFRGLESYLSLKKQLWNPIREMCSFRVVRKQQVVACVEFVETSRGSGKCVCGVFFFFHLRTYLLPLA